MRDRVTFVDGGDRTERDVLATADAAVFASEGTRAIPGTLVRALGAGAVAVASRLPVYEEVLADGERGLMFEAGEIETLVTHLAQLIAEPQLLRDAPRDRLTSSAGRGSRRSSRTSTRSSPPGATTASETAASVPGCRSGR